jgi:predicted phosphodiesterase
MTSSPEPAPTDYTPDSLTVAVISDIHGNLAAFEAILDQLQSIPHDQIVIAGDLVLFGPRPAETVDLVRSLNVPVILGNTDQYMIDGKEPWASDPRTHWVQARLGEDRLDYLRSLPFDHRITPPNGRSPENDLLVVHATPTDIEACLILELDRFGEWTLTPEDTACEMVGDAVADLVVFGHIHYTTAGTVVRDSESGNPAPPPLRLASIGSSGFPFDGDHRAAYGTVRWNPGPTKKRWELTHHRAEYDYESVAAELDATDAPFREMAAARIRQARFVGRPAHKK